MAQSVRAISRNRQISILNFRNFKFRLWGIFRAGPYSGGCRFSNCRLPLYKVQENNWFNPLEIEKLAAIV